MVNDTTTLMGSLYEFGETLAENLESMGVSDVDSEDGLTYLANKILDIEPSVSGLELTTNLTLTTDSLTVKTNTDFTLSTTLTASYDDTTQEDIDIIGVLTGAVILFKDGDENIIGQAVTDNTGTATYTLQGNIDGTETYTTVFMGTNNFDACSSTSLTITFQSAVYVRTEEVSYTRDSTYGAYKLYDEDMSIDLPTNCEITFDWKCTGGTSSNEHRLFFAPKKYYTGSSQPSYGFYIENYGGSSGATGRRINGSSSNVTTFTASPNTWYSVKYVIQGTTISFYVDGVARGSYSHSVLNDTDWCFFFTLWNSGTMWIRNMLIEEK